MFAAITDNCSLAKLTADYISGFSGNGCVCHMLSLCLKVDVMQKSSAASILENPISNIRKLSPKLTHGKLSSALSQEQLEIGLGEKVVHQLQDGNETLWYSLAESLRFLQGNGRV